VFKSFQHNFSILNSTFCAQITISCPWCYGSNRNCHRECMRPD